MPDQIERVEQPPVVEFYIGDDLFVKQMWMKRRGYIVPQHSHEYDHVSMLAKGSVELWMDGVLTSRFTAPTPITIKAGHKHNFIALEDDTIVYCIHNLHGHGYPAILEENGLGD